LILAPRQRLLPAGALLYSLYEPGSSPVTLSYQFVSPQQTITQGLQTDPILLQDGRTPLTNSYLEVGEQFWRALTSEWCRR
jgi:hypothetical protein